MLTRSIMTHLSGELHLGRVRRGLVWHQGMKGGCGKGPSMAPSDNSVDMYTLTSRGWLTAEEWFPKEGVWMGSANPAGNPYFKYWSTSSSACLWTMTDH